MSWKPLLASVLALAAGISTVPALPAAAQCRLCESPTTDPEQRLGEERIALEIETSLDFDRLILLGSGEGSATLRPYSTRSVSGVVSGISGRAMVGSAVVHGDVEGAIVKSGGIGFEGLDLELVDSTGKTVASARTDFDGFFLFERVPYGEYRIRLSKDSAAATGLARDLSVAVSVSAAKSIVRRGSIHVEPAPRIAVLQ